MTEFLYSSGPWIEIHHSHGDKYYYNPANSVLTPVDPRDVDNAEVLQLATREMHQQLAAINLREGVTIVVWFTKEMRRVRTANYYLVRGDRREIFWPEDVTYAILGVTPCRNGNCFSTFPILKQALFFISEIVGLVG